MTMPLKKSIPLVWIMICSIYCFFAIETQASSIKDVIDENPSSNSETKSIQSSSAKDLIDEEDSDSPDASHSPNSPCSPVYTDSQSSSDDESAALCLEETFEIYQKRAFSSNFGHVALGEGLYLEGVNDWPAYESIVGYSYKRSPQYREVIGANIIEKIMTSYQGDEAMQHKIIRVLQKESDDADLKLVGVLFLSRFLDDPTSILINDFGVDESIHPFKSHILRKLFELYPSGLPGNLYYLYSLNFNNVDKDLWNAEFKTLHDNGFHEQEVYVELEEDELACIESSEFYENYEARYKGKKVHSFTFVRLPLDGNEKSHSTQFSG